jgi:hypothetical protein
LLLVNPLMVIFPEFPDSPGIVGNHRDFGERSGYLYPTRSKMIWALA